MSVRLRQSTAMDYKSSHAPSNLSWQTHHTCSTMCPSCQLCSQPCVLPVNCVVDNVSYLSTVYLTVYLTFNCLITYVSYLPTVFMSFTVFYLSTV